MPALRWRTTLANLILAAFVPASLLAARESVALDTGWRFQRGDLPAIEASAPSFDDAGWQAVAVPHDWSIEGAFSETAPTASSGGFLPSGVAWYRRTFALPKRAGVADANDERCVFLELDGVMAHSEVWIDGHSLGRRPSGYVALRYDLTPHLARGGVAHTIAVRTDTSGQPASRWYTGAGIYRNAKLVVTDAVHVEPAATFVFTPTLTADRAVVRVQGRIRNATSRARSVSVRLAVVPPGGGEAVRSPDAVLTLPAGEAREFFADVTLNNPARWDLAAPHLGTATVEVREGERLLDAEPTRFGVREFRFESDSGFWINGRNVKIKGVCLHHDGGAFGAAVPVEIWEARLRTLRAAGVNAIRTAHNPPSSEFLDLCDRTGFLVLHEIFDVWTVGKRTFDYHRDFAAWWAADLRDTVRRDRNHPSIFAYSAGNEIHDTPQPELAKRILAGLIEAYHREDPTRPVTQGLFRPNRSGDYRNGLADMLDVVGQNYRDREILAAHREKPTRKILGTENGHDLHTWIAMRDYAPHAGQFLWAGVDYLGESRAWPYIATDFGLLDRTGHPYPRYFQRASWWSAAPVLRMYRRTGGTPATAVDPGYEGTPAQRNLRVLFDDWAPENAAAHDETVEIFSNLADVELELNGASLGSKPRPADDTPRRWTVPFAAGTLRAVGRDAAGKVAAMHELRTPGAPAKLVARVGRVGEGSLQVSASAPSGDVTTPSRSDANRGPNPERDGGGASPFGNQITAIEFFITDFTGTQCPRAEPLVAFEVAGPAEIAAVDNGDNRSHESFRGAQRSAFNGRVVVWLRRIPGSSPGFAPKPVRVTARAEGLMPVSVEF